MKVIERSNGNFKEIEEYFEKELVLFEHTILESEQFMYSICYCPLLDVYDVVLEDIVNEKLVNYEARRKLSGSTLKYFNVFKDDLVEDMFANSFYCITHYVEVKD